MWIDEYLLQQGKTVVAFAKELEVSRTHLTTLISGKRRASKKMAEKIAEATKGEISVRRLRNIPVPERLRKKNPQQHG